MARTDLGTGGDAAAGGAISGDISGNGVHGGSRAAGSPFRGVLAGVGLLAVVGAAAGGGAIGYQLGQQQGGTSLSGPAHVQARPFAASPPNAPHTAAAVEDEAVRSDYESRIAALVQQQQRLRGELERARDRQEDARHELGRTERAYAEASRELEAATAKLESLRAEAAREDAYDLADAEALVQAKSKLKDLRLELAAARSEKQGMSRTLGTLASTMEKVIAERDEAAARAEALNEHVAALSEEQDELLAQIEDAARLSLSGMRDMFERTGVDLDRVLGETRKDYTGAGGPFEALAEEVRKPSGPTEMRVAALMENLEQVNLMRFAARRMPFGLPVEGTRLTSGFGGRDDPLGRGRAMHEGLDFAGPTGTPIRATADGVVTFSGTQRGYGRIIILSHPFGFETRYAHLNRAHVDVGDRVKRGDHIADMGNTGRSTGTHLHYEVRVEREAVDPADFLKAAGGVL